MKLTNAEKDVIQERELREIMNDAILTRKTYRDLRDVRFSTGTKFRSYLERAYGSILAYGEIHGLDTEYMVSKHILTAYRLTKTTKEEITDWFLRLAESSEELLDGQAIKDSQDGEFLLSAIDHYYGGLINIANETQTIIKTMTLAKRRNIEDEVVSDYRAGMFIEDIMQKHGVGHTTVIKWLQENDVYKEYVKTEYLSKEDTDKFLDYVIDRSYSEKITVADIRKNSRIELLSIKRYYKTFTKAIPSRGKYLLESSLRIVWSEELLINQIRLGSELNRPLNSNYMATGYGRGAEQYARLKYGSWKNAVELAGVAYNYTSSSEFAELGHEFETVVGSIFEELGYTYEKYLGGALQPDFVMQNKWIDAKLSEYTYTGKDRNGITCVDKYEPHCEELELVYLRGSGKTRKVSEKTSLVFVGEYVKRLPKEKQTYYHLLLASIEDRASGIEYDLGA